MARTSPGHFIVEDLTTTTPPGSPTHGDAYVPAATATGDWTGEEGNIAVSITSDDDTTHTWYFIAPIEGDLVWDKGANKLYVHNGSSFVDLTGYVAPSALVGTSFPGSPYDGQPFYRTDLQMQFRYFGTRGKWLSEEVEVFRTARNATGITTQSWLRRQNGADTNGAPFVAKMNGTIVGYSGAVAGTVTDSDFDVGTVASLGAGSLSAYLLTVRRTATGPFSSMSTDVDFSSGAMLAAQYDPTTGLDSGNTPSFDIAIRWRAT